MAKVIASLSEDGWVTDTTKMLDYILSYYILTDNMQSLVFRGNIISLPYTYYQHINNPQNMSVQIITDLETLLSRYFDTYTVLCQAVEIDTKKYGIAIYAAVTDSNGVKVDLSKAIKMDSSLASKIITLNNYGDAVATINSF
jgi:hypothetical protein